MQHLPMTARPPEVLSLMPGRARLHLPGWSGKNPREVERRLRILDGVQEAQANSRTGNVLIHFDRNISAARFLSEFPALQPAWSSGNQPEPAGVAEASKGVSPALPSQTASGNTVVARAVVGGTLGHAAVDGLFYTATATASALGWTWLAPVAAAHLVIDVFVWGVVLRPIARHFRKTGGTSRAEAQP